MEPALSTIPMEQITKKGRKGDLEAQVMQLVRKILKNQFVFFVHEYDNIKEVAAELFLSLMISRNILNI